jgi:hypothetical protein
MFKDLNDMITDQLVNRSPKRKKNKSKDSKTYNMQDTLIVILSFVLPNFIGGMLFFIKFSFLRIQNQA